MLVFLFRLVIKTVLIIFFAVGVFVPGEVLAHRVNVFAWVEGDEVHTQSTANRGKPIRDGEVRVYDSEGVVLLTGSTDAEGKFSFPRPGDGALKIELLAGPGHKAVWTLEEGSSNGDEVADHAHPPPIQADVQPNLGTPNHGPPLTKAEITEIVDQVVAKRVAPLQEMVAAQSSRGPGIREILGGLGYILGLVGLGAYINFRKKTAALEQRSQGEEKI